MRCPSCQAPNMPGLESCFQCGRPLTDPQEPPPPDELMPPRRRDRHRRRLTSQESVALYRWPSIPELLSPSPRWWQARRYIGVAWLYSLLPGLGHVYLGEIRAARRWALIAVAILAGLVATFWTPLARFHHYVLGGYLGQVMADAWLVREERHRDRPYRDHHRRAYHAVGACLGTLGLVLVVVVVGWIRFPMIRIDVPVTWPGIEARRAVLVADRWSYREGSGVRLGDYALSGVPQGYRLIPGVGRVVAEPGDRINRIQGKDSHFMLEVNGALVCRSDEGIPGNHGTILEPDTWVLLYQSRLREEDPRSPTGQMPQVWLTYIQPLDHLTGRVVLAWYPPRIRGWIQREPPGPWPWWEEDP